MQPNVSEGFMIEEGRKGSHVKIKVIGVGGGGGNMINHIVREGIDKQTGMKDVDLIAANTDIQALEKSLAPTRIQLGEKKTEGLGCGAIPGVGEESAKESYEEVKATLERSNIVFVAAGFGGGTGTGAGPVIARAAKESGALTVGVVTTPFGFEGKKRMRNALDGIEELKKECDTVLVVPNQKLVSIIGPKASFKESFKIVDDVLSRAVTGISQIVLNSNEGDVNVDFADIRTVMSHRGLALMAMGEATGEGAAQEAVKNAIQSPLLEDVDIKGARAALIHFHTSSDCPLQDMCEAAEILKEYADEDAEIIFGTYVDPAHEADSKVRVTLVVTGFEAVKPAAKTTLESDAAQSAVNTPKPVSDILPFARKIAVGGDLRRADDDLDTPSFLQFQQD